MSYHHLNEIERGKIELLEHAGTSRASIARQLGRSRATIYRELRRRPCGPGVYDAQQAKRLELDYPHDPWMRVCPETIDRILYTDPKWNRAFVPFLRQGRKRRRKRGLHNQRRGAIAHRTFIEQRPNANDRIIRHRVLQF